MTPECKHWEDSPAPTWALPVASAVWLGLFVDGWFANPSVRNRMSLVIDQVFDVLILPAVTLLFAWSLLTPSKLSNRLHVALFLLLTSLPIAYLAHQRPGLPWTSFWTIVQHYFNRYYSLAACGFLFFDMIVVFVLAGFSLIWLNRFLAQVHFRRVPLESSGSGKPISVRLRESFWYGSRSADEVKWSVRDKRLSIRCGILFLGITIGYFLLGRLAILELVIKAGLAYGSITYLFVWAASECYRPIRSLFVLWFGLAVLSSLPQVLRIAGPQRLTLIDELSICIPSVGLSILLSGVSLFFLMQTHQMPRRTKRLPLATDGTAWAKPNSSESARPIVTWTMGLAIFGISCVAAYWIPRNLDAENLTDEKYLSVSDGWLAAKFLEQSKGNRSIFTILRDHNTNAGHVSLKVPEVNSNWIPYISLVEQRSKQGDACELVIESPVQDMLWLSGILKQGIKVRCSIDASGASIPGDLITNPGLSLVSISNTELSVDEWSLLRSTHKTLSELISVRLPDDVPLLISQEWQAVNALTKCEISESLLAALTETCAWPFVNVSIIDPRLPETLDGLTFAKYVYHGEFLGKPPLSVPTTDGFPPTYAPVKAYQSYSRLEFSLRPALLNAQVAAAVQASRVSVPWHLGFDHDGKLTEFGVTPTRDCPLQIPWQVFPNVEHLYVNSEASSYDDRTMPGTGTFEEIGFQQGAFPNLRRVTIYTHPIRRSTVGDYLTERMIPNESDKRFEGFLAQLLEHPGINEIEIVTDFSSIWYRLMASKSIERIIITPLAQRDLRWLELLPELPNLKEIVLRDGAGLQDSDRRQRLLQDYLAILERATSDTLNSELLPNQENAAIDSVRVGRVEAMRKWMAENTTAPNSNKGRFGRTAIVADVLEGEALDRALEEADKMLKADWTALIQAVVPHVQVEVIPLTKRSLRWE